MTREVQVSRLKKEIQGSRVGIPVYAALFLFASYTVVFVKSERPLVIFIWALIGLGLSLDLLYYRSNSKKLARLRNTEP
jgi:hypothetical protein